MDGKCNTAVAKLVHHQPVFVEAEAAGRRRLCDVIGMMDDVQHIDPGDELADEARLSVATSGAKRPA
jgi:hypothetical protein